jgi:N-acyl-D-aspartate/D-glutamate deacylase
MSYDLLIKNGTVLDGTGSPRRQADVAVRDGRIAEVGRVTGPAKQVIDAHGLFVTPGFIDIHTHYDCQLFWDPLATSSCWHGVITVVTGNCGLTLAPCKPGDRDAVMGMFARVEEINASVLKLGLPWDWETFPQWMDRLDRRLGLNVAPLVGHAAIRLYAMGEASIERTATAEEIQRMQALLDDALDAGAFGWSTSLSPTHVLADGGPVPSRLADDDELLALARTLARRNTGSIGIIPRTVIAELSQGDLDLLYQLSKTSGRAVHWNGHRYKWDYPDGWKKEQDYMAQVAKKGAQVYGLSCSTPFNRTLTFKRTSFFLGLRTWRETMELPLEVRKLRLADPALRQAYRDAIDFQNAGPAEKGMQRPRIRWAAFLVDTAALPKNRWMNGKSVTDLAKQTGKHIADVIIDLILEENFETKFRSKPSLPEDEPATIAMLSSPYTLPYQSDAGAHISGDCIAGDHTYFLSHWVRERGLMSWEEAVRKYTSLPASVIGLADRGQIKEGMAADIAVFDPERLKAPQATSVRDLPGGESRFVQGAEGIHCAIVNGRLFVKDGEHTGADPGRVLRSNARRR